MTENWQEGFPWAFDTMNTMGSKSPRFNWIVCNQWHHIQTAEEQRLNGKDMFLCRFLAADDRAGLADLADLAVNVRWYDVNEGAVMACDSLTGRCSGCVCGASSIRRNSDTVWNLPLLCLGRQKSMESPDWESSGVTLTQGLVNDRCHISTDIYRTLPFTLFFLESIQGHWH
jgi:hypothetical protein